MSFSTPLFCVSLISLYSALRALNLMKLLHPRNPRYKTGSTIVHLVSSLPVTVHISQFLLGLWTILTPTFTYLRSAFSLPPTSAIMKTLPLKHADTNAISLLLPFYEPFLLIQPCLVTDFLTFRLPVLHLRRYHVLPSPHLLPSSLPDLSNRLQGQHNLPTRRRLRPLVHNTLLLQVLGRIPSKGSAPSGRPSGYMSQFPDNTRPVGSSSSSADRTGRGPYHKGKGADKGTFKGKDKFPSDWPPLNPGPPKGSSKNSPGSTPKGSAKGTDKGKSHGKGIAPPTVYAPPANPSPHGHP